MIDPNIKLTILHDNGGTFSDYSNEMADYLNNTVTLTLTDDDYLYTGFKKPFNVVYFDMATKNINPATMLVEYYDGTSWVSAEYTDDSRGLTKNGLVTWDKSLMNSVAIDGKDKYYIRMSLSVSSSSITFNGANIVFSDDVDLQQEFFEITNSAFLPAGSTSHIHAHVAARNQIMQELRNRGNQTSSSGVQTDLTAFDLHNIYQVREASMFLALSKIFFRISDNLEDHWFMKFEEYRNRYKEAMSLYSLNLDTDQDGKEEQSENNKYKVFRFSR